VTRFPYSFDRVASVYDETRALPDQAVRRLASALGEIVQEGRLLEVGVGTGRLAIPLQTAGMTVVGTDVSGKMVQIGREKGLRNAILADAHHLPFTDKAFRTAMTSRVLHLLADWRLALSEICRVTKDRYCSVLERESAKPDLDAEYGKIVLGRGGDTGRPGLYERDLARYLAPDVTVEVGVFHGTEPADRTIEMLGRRVFSSQWAISEEVHREAIATLGERYAGTMVATKNDIEIAVWNITRLHDFLREPDKSDGDRPAPREPDRADGKGPRSWS
jgi:SAM-dependent methyltransferase